MDYTLTPDDEIDWERPVHVTCLVCHARHDITGADVLQADTETARKRCAAAVTYPAGAARVIPARPGPGRVPARGAADHRGPGRPRAPGDLPRGQAARRKAAVKTRLWGTADECRQMAQLLIDASCFEVLSVSEPYADRGVGPDACFRRPGSGRRQVIAARVAGPITSTRVRQRPRRP